MSENALNVDAMVDQLDALAANAQSIASAGICAAGGVLVKSIRSRSPAPLHDYIGFRQIRSRSHRVRLVVGFGYGRKSRKSTRAKPPTQAQTDRLAQFVRTGIASGMSPAIAAMEQSTSRRIDAILEQGT